jgi:hypothetical protein
MIDIAYAPVPDVPIVQAVQAPSFILPRVARGRREVGEPNDISQTKHYRNSSKRGNREAIKL